MASIPFAISSPTLLIFLISLFPSSTLSQDPNSIPTIAQCAPRLLPLATCAPFVQGTAPSPAQSCCDNLILVYSQQPSCLCLLLNDTTLSSFPINTTLTLQLPALCTLPVDTSACLRAQVPPSSSSSQVSFGANNSTVTNSTVASSPMVQAAPRPTMMGAGFGRSASNSIKSKTGTYLAVTLTMAGFLMPGIFWCVEEFLCITWD